MATEDPRTVDDGDVPIPDRPLGVDDWGTTKREEELGESFESRVAREVPDQLPADDGHLAQRLVEPGDDDGIGIDDEPDLVGELGDSVEGDTLSAEEAAMRVVDEPPGVSY